MGSTAYRSRAILPQRPAQHFADESRYGDTSCPRCKRRMLATCYTKVIAMVCPEGHILRFAPIGPAPPGQGQSFRNQPTSRESSQRRADRMIALLEEGKSPDTIARLFNVSTKRAKEVMSARRKQIAGQAKLSGPS